MEVKTMKKVLTVSAVTLAFAFLTTIALSGGATARQKVKIAPAVVTTATQCHYPEDPNCPLTPEQTSLVDVGHDLTPDQQKVIDDAWSDDSKLTPEELAIKKKYNIQ